MRIMSTTQITKVIILNIILMLLSVSAVVGYPNGNCNFENGMCNWQSSKSSDFQWQLGNGSTSDSVSGPSGDHTFEDAHGHYLFIKGLEARTPSKRAEVYTDYSASKDMQLSFWYFMNGIGIGTLSVEYRFANGSTLELWEKRGRQGQSWIKAQMDLPSDSFQLVITATARKHYGGDLAIDDISIDSRHETTTSTPTTKGKQLLLTAPYTCDFDKDMCEMYPSTPEFSLSKWMRTNGSQTFKGKTYILGDNSTESGFYMMFNTPKVGQNGDTAQLTLPFVDGSRDKCLTFSYLMPSKTSGTLSVFLQYLASGKQRLFHEMSGYHGEEWILKYVSLPASEDFRIIIEGTYSGEPASFLAVDDIQILNDHCIDYTTTSTTPTTPTNPPISVIPDESACPGMASGPLPAVSCTFDEDLCSYNISGTLNWERQKGKYDYLWFTHIPEGIGGDNDTYIRSTADSFSAALQSTTDLKSNFVNGSHICLQFWYFYPGKSSSLTLLLETEWGAQEKVWEGHVQEKKWQKETVEIKSVGIFRVIFRNQKKSISSTIGLNDIRGYNILPFSTTTSTTTNAAKPKSSTGTLSTHALSSLSKTSTRSTSLPKRSTAVTSSFTRASDADSNHNITSASGYTHTSVYNATNHNPSSGTVDMVTKSKTESHTTFTNKSNSSQSIGRYTRVSSERPTTGAVTMETKNKIEYSSAATVKVETNSEKSPSLHTRVSSGRSTAGTVAIGTNNTNQKQRTAATVTVETNSKTGPYTPWLSTGKSVELQSTPPSGVKTSTPIHHDTGIHSTENSKDKGDHTTEVVTGVCVPIVCFIMVFIIFYLYKKNHSKNLKVESSEPEKYVGKFTTISMTESSKDSIPGLEMEKLQ